MDAFVSSAGSRTVQAVLILEDYPKPALLLSVSPTSSPQVPSMPGTSDARPEHTAVVASGSEQSMKFGESIPERRPAPSVKDALGHLNLIRWECEYLDNFTWPRQRRSKYNLFLDLMKEYDSQQIDTSGVINCMIDLFGGSTRLLNGFNIFLPVGFRVGHAYDHRDLYESSITVTTPQGTAAYTHRASRFPRYPYLVTKPLLRSSVPYLGAPLPSAHHWNFSSPAPVDPGDPGDPLVS